MCLGFGYKRNACKDLDCYNICRNCWIPEHVGKDCKAKPYCSLCEAGEGDETDNRFSESSKCLTFQILLQEMLKK